MEDFIVTGPESYIPMMQYRLECKKRKLKGKIIEGKSIFHITKNGNYLYIHVEYPTIVKEVERLLYELGENIVWNE